MNDLPMRSGHPPRTTPTNPHTQLEQNPEREDVPAGPREAFMIGREFAHIHPMPDGSLHAALPPDVAQEAISKGWAEQHPVARMGYIPQNVVMIHAPRDEKEIEAVAELVVEAYRFASGTAPDIE